ncbi:MAG TPA: cytochrome c [Vicinamibacterales bacterium]|nr:cytochrome c [Vicinamibacterales bacterium]
MNNHGRKTARAALVVLGLSFGAGACRQDMHDAPRYDPLEASSSFSGGASARPLVAGTVARGHLNDDAMLTTGIGADGKPTAVFPFPITRADLDRGEQRFNIYCAPCHGRTGEGNGMVVQRGYRQAASYHIDRLRDAPVGYFFDVVSNGFGAMPDYRAQIPVEDRWRIVAYVRALQLSHHATTADVPAAELERLKSGAPAPAPAPAAGSHAGGSD